MPRGFTLARPHHPTIAGPNTRQEWYIAREVEHTHTTHTDKAGRCVAAGTMLHVRHLPSARPRDTATLVPRVVQGVLLACVHNVVRAWPLPQLAIFLVSGSWPEAASLPTFLTHLCACACAAHARTQARMHTNTHACVLHAYIRAVCTCVRWHDRTQRSGAKPNVRKLTRSCQLLLYDPHSPSLGLAHAHTAMSTHVCKQTNANAGTPAPSVRALDLANQEVDKKLPASPPRSSLTVAGLNAHGHEHARMQTDTRVCLHTCASCPRARAGTPAPSVRALEWRGEREPG